MKARENVRTRHDEWVKRALSLWLDGLGDVQIDARIAGESRRGDVLYAEKRGNPARRRALGLLGELARGHVLFEPFRNPITARELMTCVLKVIDHTAQRARAARRAKQKQSTVKGTVLCVITPSLSADFLAEAEARPIDDEKPGVYGLAPLWRTVILVVDTCPKRARRSGSGCWAAAPCRRGPAWSCWRWVHASRCEMLPWSCWSPGSRACQCRRSRPKTSER